MPDPSRLDYGRQPGRTRFRRLWRLAKWTGVGLAAVVAVALLTHAMWLWTTGRQLRLAVARLAAAGEPTTAAALTPATRPAGGNGYDALVSLGNGLLKSSPAMKRRDDISGDAWPLTPLERGRLAARVAEQAVVLPWLDAVLDRPDLDDTTPLPGSMLQFGTVLPELNNARETANLMADAIMLDHDAGRDDAALARLTRLGRLADATATKPILVATLVGLGIRAMETGRTAAIAATLKIGPAPGDAAPAAVRRTIANLLDSTRGHADLRHGLRGERVFVLQMADAITAGQYQYPTFGSKQPLLTGGNYGFVGRYLQRPMMKTVATYSLHNTNVAIDATQLPDWPATQAKFASGVWPPPAYLPKDFAGGMGGPGEFTLRAVHDVQAQRVVAAVALAARLHAVERGGPPRAWNDLVPAYLPAVPTDPMSGKPLLADFTSAGPRVWGVGRDGVDNGGVEMSGNNTGDTLAWLGERTRTLDDTTKQLTTIDADVPVAPTTGPTTGPSTRPTPQYFSPENPDFATVTAFDARGDSAAVALPTRGDVFRVLNAVSIRSVNIVGAASPAVTGHIDVSDGRWHFTLGPDHLGTWTDPQGRTRQFEWDVP